MKSKILVLMLSVALGIMCCGCSNTAQADNPKEFEIITEERIDNVNYIKIIKHKDTRRRFIILNNDDICPLD